LTLVYLDTNVWLSRFLTKDKNNPKTTPIFQKISNGSYTVLLSHHVLHEILEVIRKKVIINQKKIQDTSNITYCNSVNSEFSEIIRLILTLPNVRIQNPNVSTDRIFRVSLEMMSRHQGEIQIDSECPICKATYDYWDCDAPDERDMLHALLALNLDCDLLISFDSDFRKLQNEKYLSSLAISVL